MSIPQELRSIWRIVVVVMTNLGFTLGLYLFTYGAYFYDTLRFHGAAEESAMLLTAVLFIIHLGLIAFLEIPTGALGDAIGRKKTVIWSLVFRAAFFALMGLMAFANTLMYAYLFGILAMIAFAINFTLFSGSFTAWVVDAIHEKNINIGYERILGRGYSWRFIAKLLGALLGVLLYINGLAVVAYVLATLLCVSTLVFCLGEMYENQSEAHLIKALSFNVVVQRMSEIITNGFSVCRATPAIWGLIILYASSVFLLNIVDYLWPLTLKSHYGIENNSWQWVVISAAFIFVSTKGSYLLAKYGDWYQKRHDTTLSKPQLRLWVIGSCFIAACPFVFLSVSTYLSGFSFCLFALSIASVEFSYGAFMPAYETLMNHYIPKSHASERATILSLGSVLRSVLVLLLAIPAAGKTPESTIMSWALPATLLLASAFFANHLIKKNEKLHQRDLFAGGGTHD